MSEGSVEKLHSLLNDEGRELVNVKFFPGLARGLTSEKMAEAARVALASAQSSNLRNAPPATGVTASTLEEFLRRN